MAGSARPSAPPRPATDVFGNARYGCAVRGCGCTAYITPLHAMSDEELAEVESRARTLTCQRKSELSLWCTCGHPAWEHHTQAEGGVLRPPGHAASREAGLTGLLHDASLAHLEEALAGETLHSCAARLGAGRVAFLSHLRAIGVCSLTDRQKLANALGHAVRSGVLEGAPE